MKKVQQNLDRWNKTSLECDEHELSSEFAQKRAADWHNAAEWPAHGARLALTLNESKSEAEILDDDTH